MNAAGRLSMNAAGRPCPPLALLLACAILAFAPKATVAFAAPPAQAAGAAVPMMADTAAMAADADVGDDLAVHVDLEAGRPRGRARATVRIHASREVVWKVLTSCAGALEIVPGLVSCEVLQTSPDGTMQRIRHVLDYSWYLPRLTYELEAHYDRPARVTLARVAGDLRLLEVTWQLDADGADTVGHYQVTLDPGIWAPQWLVRAVLKRDLPRMLRALRARAQLAQGTTPR